MVQRRPAVRVQSVQVGVAVRDDGIQCDAFLGLCGEHGLVDGGLARDTLPVVDELATVDEVFEVLVIALMRGIVKVLEHAAGELVSADLEWPLPVVSVDRIGAHIDHVAA